MLPTETVLDGAELTLTKIGRALDCNTTVKHSIKRIDILLLMALMVEIIMRWNSLIAIQTKWHYDFQTNTVKYQRVLSIPRLGKEMHGLRRYRIQDPQYHKAMVEYQRLTHCCGLGQL